MLHNMYENHILIYTIIFLGTLGVIFKIILAGIYSSLIKAARDMGTSDNKLMKNIRIKFDACYKLKVGVNNVDIWVDKYVYSHKFSGIPLYTWENIGGQLLIVCGLIALGGSVLAYFLKCGQVVILSTMVSGGLASLVLIAFEILLNLPTKRNLLRIYMKDYLENNLKAKLENEYLMPEQMEEYRNEYFETVSEKTKTGKSKGDSPKAQKVHKAMEKTEKIAGQMSKNQDEEKIIEEILKEYFV